MDTLTVIEVSEGAIVGGRLSYAAPFFSSAKDILEANQDDDDVRAAISSLLSGEQTEATVLGFVGTAFRYRIAEECLNCNGTGHDEPRGDCGPCVSCVGTGYVGLNVSQGEA